MPDVPLSVVDKEVFKLLNDYNVSFSKKKKSASQYQKNDGYSKQQSVYPRQISCKGHVFFLAQLHVLVLVFDVSSTKIDNRLQRATTLYKLLGKA